MAKDIAEQKRLNDAREKGIAWKRWGPYLSERQWGTVREDYSRDGDAWGHFSHDQSRARAYRWGEDGLGGISDDRQRLCFALALWNGRDPILKERLFGLTNSEGNHGEDVKEYYFYVDSTPTHSYMKYLYKYPQRAYPYGDLVETGRRRTRHDPEYELIDTGVFDDDRYFDVVVEYAKAGPDDMLVSVSVHNRGPEAAVLHLLPTLWFRNTWSWGEDDTRPVLREAGGAIVASHPELGEFTLACEGSPALLFTENESNAQRLWGRPNGTRYVKDAFHRHVVAGERDAVNPERTGTKAAAHYVLEVPAGGCEVVRLRLAAGAARPRLGQAFRTTLQQRIAEADEFYDRITPPSLDEDARRVHRQALAGMLWSKQYYHFDVDRWLKERGAHPLEGAGHSGSRDAEWFHMFNSDVISMPDKWEYPWYAAWDLAFHTLALSLVDFDFAKEQLLLLLRSLYSHPNGQIPAYEWNFGDVNPPVHAWATLFLYRVEKDLGREDRAFLERSFQGLMLNFNWWVNRKDPQGRNVFAGGFLGLDNRREGRADGRRLRRRPEPAAALAPHEEEARAGAVLRARRAGIPEPARHPLAVPPTRRASLRVPGGRKGVSGGLPPRRVRLGDVRGQLQLARSGVDAGQRADRAGASQLPCVLRRRLHRRVPHRLRGPDDALRGRAGDLAPSRHDLPQGRRRPSPGVRRNPQVPGGPALARPDPLLRVLPRRRRRRPRGEPPDRMDGCHRAAGGPVRARERGRRAGDAQGPDHGAPGPRAGRRNAGRGGRAPLTRGRPAQSAGQAIQRADRRQAPGVVPVQRRNARIRATSSA